MTVHITSGHLKALQDAADAAYPAECCGILLGSGENVIALKAAENVHPSPETHFEIDPATLLAAYRGEREGGLQVLGFYHSHPSGIAAPSATDAAYAARDGKIWAIIAEHTVTFWRDHPKGFDHLSYQLYEA